MSTFLASLRTGFRLLGRQPALSVFTILTLGLGIGCLTAVASAVEALVLRALPYRSPDRLVTLRLEHPQEGSSVLIRASTFALLARETAQLAELAAIVPVDLVLEANEGPQAVDAAYATAGIFHLLGIEAAAGVADLPAGGGAPLVVVSHRAWHTYFAGDPDLIGRSVTVNGTSRTVRAILPPEFVAPFPSYSPDFWLPLPPELRSGRDESWVQVFGRLADGVASPTAARGLAEVHARILAAEGEKSPWRLATDPLSASLAGRASRNALGLFLGCFVLFLAATINAAAFVLSQERRELPSTAVKVAFGAPPRALFLDRLAAKLGPAALAGCLGVLVAAISLALYRSWGAPGLPGRFALGINVRVLAFAVFLTLLAALLWSILATIRWTRRGVIEALRLSAGPTTTERSRRGHFVLVSLQIALGFALAVAMGLMLESYARLTSVKLGFDRRQVLTAELHPASAEGRSLAERGPFYQDLLSAVRSLPGVRSAGLTNYQPFHGMSGAMQIAIENPGPGLEVNPVVIQARTVSPGYLEAMGIALADSRSRSFHANEFWGPSAVVSRRAARWLWGSEGAALGKRIKLAGSPRNPWLAVVGVCDDVRHDSVTSEPQPTVYLPLPMFSTMTLAVRYEQTDPRALTRALSNALLGVDRRQIVSNVKTVEEGIAASLSHERLAAQVMCFIAIASVLLAISGIAGATWQMGSERRRELALRFALGAERSDLIRLVRREAVPWVGLGYAAGFVASWWFARLVSVLLFDTGPYDPTNALLVLLILTGLLALGFYLPARRASRTDPASILRE